MRYKLNTNKLVNQLVPYYLSGRRYILYIQSILYPIQALNDRFVTFAKEKQIEARMTSQSLYFEWYLNRKFSQYFQDINNSLYIKDSESLGVDIYHEVSDYGKPFTVWFENDIISALSDQEWPKELYHLAEEKIINKVSFIVHVPAIRIPEQEFVYIISHSINTYKLAGMTYLIKIDSNEFEPNKRISR